MAKRKVHIQSLRLFNNAGIRFPLCYADAQLLDMDKAYLPITTHRDEVTCRKCKLLLDVRDAFQGRNPQPRSVSPESTRG